MKNNHDHIMDRDTAWKNHDIIFCQITHPLETFKLFKFPGKILKSLMVNKERDVYFRE